MYVSYEKLWKLLVEKRLTKSDLCQMTGISTRTVAKLVKNQSVTTDTLLRLCEVLDCELSDILEISKEAPTMTVYDAYKQHATLISEDEYCRLHALEYNGKQLLIKEVKKSANRRVVIHCQENGTVVWEALYPAGHTVLQEKTVISDLSFIENGKVCVLLIGGTCVGITGLDEGRFLSPSRPYEDGKLYVMSKAKWKLFVM